MAENTLPSLQGLCSSVFLNFQTLQRKQLSLVFVQWELRHREVNEILPVFLGKSAVFSEIHVRASD